MEKISKKWLKVVLWVAGYVNVIAFALVGGYVLLKSDDEKVVKETKKVFLVYLLFIVINLLVSFISSTASACFNPSTGFYSGMNVINYLISTAKVATFVSCALYAFFTTEK